MKEIDEVLKTLADGLRSLSVGISAIAAKVDDLSKDKKTAAPKKKKKSAPRKKPAVKAARKSPPKPAARKASPKPAAKRPGPKKPAKKAAGSTASAKIYGVISGTADGVNMATLKEKTGFDSKKIANILYKLKKQNQVKSIKRGIYTKV